MTCISAALSTASSSLETAALIGLIALVGFCAAALAAPEIRTHAFQQLHALRSAGWPRSTHDSKITRQIK